MLSKAAIRELQRYGRKKHRREEGRLLVEGWRSLEAAMGAGVPIEWLLLPEAGEDGWPEGLVDRLKTWSQRVDRLTEEQFRTVTASVTPPGLAGLVEWRPLELDAWIDGVTGSAPADSRVQVVVAADAVTDPGNLGTIIRTADWFGTAGLIAGAGTVDCTNPKVVQSTMGSLFQVPVGTGGDLGPALERLQAERFSVVSLELDGALDVREVDWPERLVLVVGNEARGVSEEIASRADLRVRIPRFGRAESLNAAASVAVVLGQICL